MTTIRKSLQRNECERIVTALAARLYEFEAWDDGGLLSARLDWPVIRLIDHREHREFLITVTETEPTRKLRRSR